MQCLEITLDGSRRGNGELSYNLKAGQACAQRIAATGTFGDPQGLAPGSRLIQPAARHASDTALSQRGSNRRHSLIVSWLLHVTGFRPGYGHPATLPWG